MSVKIDRDTVRHIANLSRLQLSESEEIELTENLKDILSYVESLQELDLASTEAMNQPYKDVAPKRPDVSSQTVTPDALLSNAPDSSEHYFRVPKIIEGGE